MQKASAGGLLNNHKHSWHEFRRHKDDRIASGRQTSLPRTRRNEVE
jgi:hypothetical protein